MGRLVYARVISSRQPFAWKNMPSTYHECSGTHKLKTITQRMPFKFHSSDMDSRRILSSRAYLTKNIQLPDSDFCMQNLIFQTNIVSKVLLDLIRSTAFCTQCLVGLKENTIFFKFVV